MILKSNLGMRCEAMTLGGVVYVLQRGHHLFIPGAWCMELTRGCIHSVLKQECIICFSLQTHFETRCTQAAKALGPLGLDVSTEVHVS